MFNKVKKGLEKDEKRGSKLAEKKEHMAKNSFGGKSTKKDILGDIEKGFKK